MTAMVKDLVNLEEAAIRREVIRMRLVLRETVVGRGSAGMKKRCDATAEIAALQFETHASRVQLLETEAAAVQAQIDAQESAAILNPYVEPTCHTGY